MAALSMEELQEVFDEMRIGKVVNTNEERNGEENKMKSKQIKLFQTQYVPPVPELEGEENGMD